MIDNQTTPDAIARGEYAEPDIESWFAIASARELERFILCKKPYTRGKTSLESVKAVEYIERAQIALNIRLAEDAAKTADKLSQQTDELIKHTEQLTNESKALNGQTSILVTESKNLTEQNKILVTESVNLSKLTRILIWLTVALGLFAVIQIVLMVFDIWKHK